MSINFNQIQHNQICITYQFWTLLVFYQVITASIVINIINEPQLICLTNAIFSYPFLSIFRDANKLSDNKLNCYKMRWKVELTIFLSPIISKLETLAVPSFHLFWPYLFIHMTDFKTITGFSIRSQSPRSNSITFSVYFT